MKHQRFKSNAMAAGIFAIALQYVPTFAQVPPLNSAPPQSATRTHASSQARSDEANPPIPVTLDELIQTGLAQHPKLAQAGFAIDAARGRALQAGLYPNPTVSANFDELGDRTGPQGINTIPLVSQEIVTAGKLKLDRAAACREVDQATLALLNQRALLLAGIRQAYFDVLALNQRIAILDRLVELVNQSVTTTRKLVETGLLSQLDIIQLEVELGRLEVERNATRQEVPAALRRLATAVGVPSLPITAIAGTIDVSMPDYELDRVQAHVLAIHPEIRSACIGIEKARLLVRRAEVQRIPNVTIGAGYVRQNQNQSNDWTIGVSAPIPVWNRNQGNIQAAKAMLGEATQEVARVENDLADRVAAAMREFVAARQRTENLRELRNKANQAVNITRDAATMTTLQRLESQRSLSIVELEFIRALGDAWKAASMISGLTLEEQWPLQPPPAEPKP